MARTITLTFEASDLEIENLLRRAAGDPNNGTPGGQPRNTQITTDAPATEDEEPVNANAPATDKNGVPWSADHHASSKVINADGTWRRKRGGDSAAADAYEAQFKAAAANTAPVQTTEPVAPVAAAVMPGLPTGGGLPGMPAPAPAPVSYDQIITKFNELISSGKTTVEYVGSTIYPAAGVTDPNELQTNETLRARLLAELNKLG